MEPYDAVERRPNFLVRRRTVKRIDIGKGGCDLANPTALVHLMDFVLVVHGNGPVPTSTKVLADHGRDRPAIQSSAETAADFDVTWHVQFDAVPEQFQESIFLVLETPAKAPGRIEVPILRQRDRAVLEKQVG